MNSVLEDLYHGDITPCKVTRSPTPDLEQQDEFMHYIRLLKQLLQAEIPHLETKYSFVISDLPVSISPTQRNCSTTVSAWP